VIDIANYGSPSIRIHFKGTSHDLDETISLGSDRLAPLGFYTKRKNQLTKELKKLQQAKTFDSEQT
jgi:hypothetical protein